MDKHAYLIICHNNFDQVSKLLKLLDYDKNDIYIHVDKKCRNYPKEKLINSVKKSNLCFVKPINVNWGGSSLIQAEIILLQKAIQTPHSYYHLISGNDLPIKSQDYIHDFFKLNNGKEYISLELESQANKTKNFMCRIQYYHFLQNHIGRLTGKRIAFLSKIESTSLMLQHKLKIDRTAKTNVTFIKGAQWFSITNDMAKYILQQYKSMKKFFRFSICADEIFLQTIAYSSPYHDNIEDECLRFIDWNRGEPYTFKSEDFDLLVNSDKLFARKFDKKVDNEIIERIYNHLS